MSASGTIKDTTRKIFLNIVEPNKPGKPYGAYVNEVVDGQRVSGEYNTLFINDKTPDAEGNTKFMTVSMNFREREENGDLVQIPRTNADGEYLDNEGNKVDSAEKAGTMDKYIRYPDASKLDENGEPTLKFATGDRVVINVQNTRQDPDHPDDKTKRIPSKMTTLFAVLYSEEKALEIARALFDRQQFEKGTPEYEGYDKVLKDLQRKGGEKVTLFINSGHQFLREQGIEVREKEASPSPTPA